MLLRPDFTFYLKGIRVRRYDLTQHNPNAIPMPTAVMDRDSIVGITIHNTNRKPPLYSMGTAEQCVWKTMHQELKDVRVHFYVDEYGAWQRCRYSSQAGTLQMGQGTAIAVPLPLNVRCRRTIP